MGEEKGCVLFRVGDARDECMMEKAMNCGCGWSE